MPVVVDVDTEVTLISEDSFFAALDRRGSSGVYTVTALLRSEDETDPAALTANRLKSAGTDFPDGILEVYAADPAEGIVGPETLKVLDEIHAITGPNPTEYDLAKAIEAYLRDGAHFQYDTNLGDDDIDCDALSAVECFATFRHGFCQYYAAMMTALLREQGFPARIAEGFRKGQRDLATGIVTVKNSDAHAWVEVYFPTLRLGRLRPDRRRHRPARPAAERQAGAQCQRRAVRQRRAGDPSHRTPRAER